MTMVQQLWGLLLIVNIKSLILVRSVDEIVATGTLIKHMWLDYLDKRITSIVYYFLSTMKGVRLHATCLTSRVSSFCASRRPVPPSACVQTIEWARPAV
jgi:hypothetical protein